jgi:hypothetical protein
MMLCAFDGPCLGGRLPRFAAKRCFQHYCERDCALLFVAQCLEMLLPKFEACAVLVRAIVALCLYHFPQTRRPTEEDAHLL